MARELAKYQSPLLLPPGNSCKSRNCIGTFDNSHIQESIVKGSVTDEAGDGLPGVSVVVKGSQRGVITDGSGKYEISGAEPESVLIFSFVGYLPKEEL